MTTAWLFYNRLWRGCTIICQLVMCQVDHPSFILPGAILSPCPFSQCPGDWHAQSVESLATVNDQWVSILTGDHWSLCLNNSLSLALIALGIVEKSPLGNGNPLRSCGPKRCRAAAWPEPTSEFVSWKVAPPGLNRKTRTFDCFVMLGHLEASTYIIH